MIVRTKNSTYEVDLPNHRIKRVEGKQAPTAYMGSSEWREFTSIQIPGPGAPMMIVWGPKADGPGMVRTTFTSLVDTLDYTAQELTLMADALVETAISDVPKEE
ncbi:MAG: hypothetical protein ACYDHY_06525 [Acidiferrobacterales bacterium]